jgi:hypothetical protein
LPRLDLVVEAKRDDRVATALLELPVGAVVVVALIHRRRVRGDAAQEQLIQEANRKR